MHGGWRAILWSVRVGLVVYLDNDQIEAGKRVEVAMSQTVR